MSIIDELLIFLDEGKTVNLNEIKKNLPDRTLQTVSSTLGRLEAKKWIKISKNKKEDEYQITPLGQDEVTKNLQEIKKMQRSAWDKSWQIITFNIPEKIRYARDAFRTNLEILGYGRVQNSLWISCQSNDTDLNKIISNLKINKYVTYFNTGELNAENQKKIVDSFEWNWELLNKNYKEFLAETRKFFFGKKNLFKAKKLVYMYSKILQCDPKFPKEIQPRSYLGNSAFEAYLKIRPYCYK